jgi:hypothetical protein
MREYQPRWTRAENSANATGDSTDSLTAHPETVSAVSGPNKQIADSTGAVGMLRVEIMRTLDVEPDQFDRRRYDALWARLVALNAQEHQP